MMTTKKTKRNHQNRTNYNTPATLHPEISRKGPLIMRPFSILIMKKHTKTSFIYIVSNLQAVFHAIRTYTHCSKWLRFEIIYLQHCFSGT